MIEQSTKNAHQRMAIANAVDAILFRLTWHKYGDIAYFTPEESAHLPESVRRVSNGPAGTNAGATFTRETLAGLLADAVMLHNREWAIDVITEFSMERNPIIAVDRPTRAQIALVLDALTRAIK